jgi:hypothetical protein
MFSRMMRRLALLGLLVLEVGGCATLEGQPEARLGLMLAPGTLGDSISVQQSLRVERDGRIDHLDVALEVNPERLQLIGLAFGQRVLRLSYDGQTLQTWRHLLLPPQVRAEDILEDVQLTLWPADAVRQALPEGWRIEESDLRRTLLLNDTPVMLIEYSNPTRWSGKVELLNLRYHYRLIIRSAPTTP